jgi:hypothetical protein
MELRTGKLDQQITRFDAVIGDKEQKGDAVVAKIGADASSAIEEAKQNVEAFRKSVSEALALRSPTLFWTRKKRGHQVFAGIAVVLFSLVAACGIWGVYQVWKITAEPHFSPGHDLSYTALVPTIGAALLGAWFLRLISRQMIAHFALSSDAAERVAMVKTFLALMEIPEHVKDEHRTLILAALFRSSTRPEDDAAPPTLMEAVAKLGGGRT